MTALLTPGKRGFKGVGGGAHTYMQAPVEHRGSSRDLAGFNPWVVGGNHTSIGLPLGRINSARGKVGIFHCDPISWFTRAQVISSPSAFIIGLNGLGKSSLIRRWILGMAGYGIPSLVLGDVKGEHVKVITALGGQVLNLGRGLGCLNVLDITEAISAAKTLPTAAAGELLSLARARRAATLESFFAIEWGHEVSSRERSILAEAMRVMDATVTGEAIMKDLLQIIITGPDSVRAISLCRGDDTEYQRLTVELEATLTAWVQGHGLGEVFSGKTTVRLQRGQSSVFSVATIREDDVKLRAAAMVASWSAGFGHVAIGHALGDLTPVQIVQDELWQVLQLPGLVDRFDTLTRLDRFKLVGRIMASHGLGDLDALEKPADRIKAGGFIARSGIVMCAGLPASEMPLLQRAGLHLSAAEQDYLTSNAVLTQGVRSGEHPGCGNFLAKMTREQRPGVPFHLDLVPAELGAGGLNDTNLGWDMRR